MKALRTVSLNGLEMQARIGVYEYEREEARLFLVDISLEMPAEVKAEAVELKETLDYEKLLFIIQSVMKEPEWLLETVANRIVMAAQKEFPDATAMSIHILKKNPPLKAKVDSSSVKLFIKF